MPDRKPLHIAHVLAPASFGGLETVVRALAAGHVSRGHRATVIAVVDADDHPFAATARAIGASVVEIRATGRQYLRERRDFAATLARIRPDVVHSHGYRTDILDLPVARAAGIATVSTMHGFTSTDWKLRIYERLQIRSVRAAHAVVAVSGGIEQRLREYRVPRARLHVIRNAYAQPATFMSRTTARAALGVPLDACRVGWVGRLSEEKGPDVMLATMALLPDHVTLSFVGDGSSRAALEHLAEQLGIQQRVTFHGAVPNASTLLPAFDVLALSSRTEGTPMVILEAMAAETPIAATRVGGVPDVLSDEDALLVDSERPDLLAAALTVALNHSQSSAERARHAHQRLISEFAEEAWLDKYLELYASLLR